LTIADERDFGLDVFEHSPDQELNAARILSHQYPQGNLNNARFMLLNLELVRTDHVRGRGNPSRFLYRDGKFEGEQASLP